ncbi:protein kinase [Arthrobacter jiangjiafuii]|uniref:non-specific serine/threonine protein kinase n=1 Tax=Arthrobacter jiangjiafuii TaxID=2817475 RepID=A0A975R1G3_9MICC|nr:protein kinase [Arthrobacter jiangjiafuii]MBP3044297.1 protein kinase [Arthrobacter jiangjiafuii]QWC11252.1 protein kinase [Arthrobacter jiangjiafuii]
MDVYNDGSGAARPPVVEQGFRVGRLLGSGARARVWLAVREDDGARFALKIPVTEQPGRTSTFETRRELNILSRFEHENLLQLYTVLDTDQGAGLLMEYAPGQSLARLAAARGQLAPGEAVTVLAGIASALAYLADQGMTHGDISPGNILFTAHGKPLLADLGVRGLAGPAQDEIPWTSGFRDPATSAGPGGPARNPEADVYSLAAVGWFILAGHLPPAPEHRRPSTALAAGIPPALAAALEAGLDPEPRRRPDAAAFGELVLTGTPFEPVDLALPSAAPAEEDIRPSRSRERPRRGRRAHYPRHGLPSEQRGADPFTAVRPRWLNPGPTRRALARGVPGPRRLGLAAAALLVSATLGLGAVAVAAPGLLAPPPDAVTDGVAAAKDVAGAEEDPGAGKAADAAQPAPERPTGTGEGTLSGVTGQELTRMQRSDDPAQAVRALAELRARAFLAGDAAQLEAVNVPGSPAMAADTAELATLTGAGTVLDGLGVEVLSVGPAVPAEAAGGHISVPATVSTSAYSERDPGGGSIRTVAALPKQEVVLVLAPGPQGWRIQDILAPS